MGILTVAAGFSPQAQAQNYPWCATYTGSMGGSQNCGFTSFEQCMDTVRGMGGFCDRNTQYVAPGAGTGSNVRRRAQNS